MRNIKLLIALIVCVSTFAQNSGGKYDYKHEPKELSKYQEISYLDDLYSGRVSLNSLTFSSDRLWNVYSDRANNKLYNRPGGTSLPEVLTFMEPLFVGDIEGDWLHVYSAMVNTGGNPKYHQDRGWIQAKNLVLSKYAVLSEKGTPKKGMALINLSDKDNMEGLKKEDLINYPFYNDPINKNQKALSSKFEIFFILKEFPGYKLMSKSDKLSNNGVALEGNVMGWMEDIHITNWNTRLCLEPAFNKNAVDDYEGKVIPVFFSKLNLLNPSRFDLTDGAIMKKSLRREIQSPYEYRMPVLEDINGILKVATVGKMDYEENPSGEAPPQVVIKEELDKYKTLAENINILFVIDGTQSMKDYYPAVARSVSSIVENNELNNLGNLRFGAVVYRDYADLEATVEIKEISRNTEELIDFLSREDMCKSKDNDLPEALYNGLINIEDAGFVERQSNIVVLIGDAGNHYPDPKGIKLADVLGVVKKYDVSFISFQVINGRDQSFEDFNIDSKNFIQGIARKTSEGKNGSLQRDSRIKNTLQLDYGNDEITKLYPFGRFTYANMNLRMNTAELEKNVVGSVTANLVAIQKKLSALDGIGSGGGGPTGSKYNKEARYIAATNLAEQTGKSIEYWLEGIDNMGEFSFEGYTKMKFHNLDIPCYENVIYLSQTEFESLIDTFDRLNRSMGRSKTRIAFQQALILQASSLLGSASEEVVKEKTLGEIWGEILNIPFDPGGKKYGDVGSIKLKDIVNSKSKNYDRFYNDFIYKIKGFGPDKYMDDRSFNSGGTRHYWVPLKDFPGNG